MRGRARSPAAALPVFSSGVHAGGARMERTRTRSCKGAGLHPSSRHPRQCLERTKTHNRANTRKQSRLAKDVRGVQAERYDGSAAPASQQAGKRTTQAGPMFQPTNLMKRTTSQKRRKCRNSGVSSFGLAAQRTAAPGRTQARNC